MEFVPVCMKQFTIVWRGSLWDGLQNNNTWLCMVTRNYRNNKLTPSLSSARGQSEFKNIHWVLYIQKTGKQKNSNVWAFYFVISLSSKLHWIGPNGFLIRCSLSLLPLLWCTCGGSSTHPLSPPPLQRHITLHSQQARIVCLCIYICICVCLCHWITGIFLYFVASLSF